MADIISQDNTWDLVISPGANPVETINKMSTEGYKAVIGYDPTTEKHVVMNVQYDKKKFTLNEVAEKVEKLRTCGRCSTLDKSKLNLGTIRVNTVYEGDSTIPADTGVTRYPQEAAKEPVISTLSTPPLVPSIDLRNMFANVLFDAYFTRPGLFFLASMTGDSSMLERIMPKTEAEATNMMSEMIDFFSGDVEFFRSPEDAKEHLNILRSGVPADQQDKQIAGLKKNKRLSSPGILIY